MRAAAAVASQRGGRGGGSDVVPLEWIVDVADEHGAFHIGTAYEYDDARGTLRVAIPDQAEPTWQARPRVCFSFFDSAVLVRFVV